MNVQGDLTADELLCEMFRGFSPQRSEREHEDLLPKGPVETDVRVALGKAGHRSLNLRDRSGTFRWEKIVRLFLAKKPSVLPLYLHPSVPAKRMIHCSNTNKQLWLMPQRGKT